MTTEQVFLFCGFCGMILAGCWWIGWEITEAATKIEDAMDELADKMKGKK